MQSRKNIENKGSQEPQNTVVLHREKISRLCECENILSDSDIDDFPDYSKFDKDRDEYVVEDDACDVDLEAQRLKLLEKLKLPDNTYSLVKIETNLPKCVTFGYRSGSIHMNMHIFSVLTRGRQGPAMSLTAIATSQLLKPNCWTDTDVDQVVMDGNAYCRESFEDIYTYDRDQTTLLELKRHVDVRKSHRIFVNIHDPLYCGTFKSESPRELHVARALELFFDECDSCVLTSPVLNIAIWKTADTFNIFDAQPRLDNCEITPPEGGGTAKLILLKDLCGVLFIILEKSNVTNEPYVLYGISIKKIKKLCEISNEPTRVEEPKCKTSGYQIHDQYRAVLQGSFHLDHSTLPEEFRNKGHLIIAIVALIYSKLISGKRWTKQMIDLIINQSNIYLVDLARVLNKTLDDKFELNVTELLCDVIFGVYIAKIKVDENVIPGKQKKSKATMDVNIREFFERHNSGLLEIKKTFYAIWREGTKYYFLDPFGCDPEGFRIDPKDSDNVTRYQQAAACVTMNSSVDQLMETILENTLSKEKDPLVIHKLNVLYIKTQGQKEDGSDDKVIFREKNTNRRPPRPPTPPSTVTDECEIIEDPVPQPRPAVDATADKNVQYPALMAQADEFIKTFDPEKSLENHSEEELTLSACFSLDLVRKCQDVMRARCRIVNSHRMMLKATKSCLHNSYSETSRGRFGLIVALGVLAEEQQTKIQEWTSIYFDHIIDAANESYEKIVTWLLNGSQESGLLEENYGVKSMRSGQTIQSNLVKSELEMQGLEYINLSMLPGKMRIGNNDLSLVAKINVVTGNTNPMANLGEALEKYFEHFDCLILENKKLVYGIWKKYDLYFVLNPYGSDRDGWRNIKDPAAISITESINEVVNILYGLLEFNEYRFVFHYVKVMLLTNDEDMDYDAASEVSEIVSFEKFETKFLPVTNDDLAKIDAKNQDSVDEELEITAMKPLISTTISERNLDTQGSKLQNSKDVITGKTSSKTGMSKVTFGASKLQPLDLFERTIETELTDSPVRLNLALVTGLVKININDNEPVFQKNLDVHYEKLKYSHPPPFVTPPKRNLCNLLGIKLASKSVHSLLSRFSIDSKLSVKAKIDLPVSPGQAATISVTEMHDKSKLITLPPKKYFYSLTLPNGLTPIRAINELFIRDKAQEEINKKQCKMEKGKKEVVMIPDPKQTLPSLIPLGPCIKTPDPKPKYNDCPENFKTECFLGACEGKDKVLNKLVCSTENLLLEMMVPEFQCKHDESEDEVGVDDFECGCTLDLPTNNENKPVICGFLETDNENIGIISANSCLNDRETEDDYHYKTCYFSAILCILAKVNMNVHEFTGIVLDRFIAGGKKISEGTGPLRYKMRRWLRSFEILGVKCNVIVKQVRYADPQFEFDNLGILLQEFLSKNQTGLLVFGNVTYAFWTAEGSFFVFDSYPCDDNGVGCPSGTACLMQICDVCTFIERIVNNTGEPASKPFRLYTLAISHLEKKKKKKRKPKKKFSCLEDDCDEEQGQELEQCESEESLIELVDWVTKEKTCFPVLDTKTPGFSPVKGFCASAIEVEVLENKITRPDQAPFDYMCPAEGAVCQVERPERQSPYDRKFYEGSALEGPIDIVFLAWAQIYEPSVWSVRTIKALFEASLEYSHDSVLASHDTSVPKMTDHLLNEFSIANYSFRVVFAPLHVGILYSCEGWNLTMSLEKIFQSPVYTGAILVCEEARVAVMKSGDRFYAWWTVKRTKKIRIIASVDMEDYLRLLVKELNKSEETEFKMRVVTISYAKMFGPNCSDIEGLHESMLPSSEIDQVHRKNTEEVDADAVFRPIDKCRAPLYVLGSVALCERDAVVEPRLKRCYFAAVFAIVLRRDMIQSPLPGMVDKVLELAERAYKLLEQPKYHTEHILKDVEVNGRLFSLRDCASELTSLVDDGHTTSQNLPGALKQQLGAFFRKCTAGLVHFPNCCYGFWFSPATCCYYYLDPYPSDAKGRRCSPRGSAFLGVFPTLCDMVKQMCRNQFEDATGFFVHRVHVESVEPVHREQFREDPAWTYLDCHWSHGHASKLAGKRPTWKSYAIEVPRKVYSAWATIGTFDARFGKRAGKTQAAIGVAMFAMRNLCHPADWCTATLDSAVLCGDDFFKQSRKASTRCLNKYNLSECLKVGPHRWGVQFGADLCGQLYSSGEQPSLASCVERAVARAPNLLVQCKGKIVAVLQASDGFYAVDSAWTGPPLFAKGRGAAYAIRVKDTRKLVYVLVKMLNTNQKLDLTVTPVEVSYCLEPADGCADARPKPSDRVILDKPARCSPGQVVAHQSLVCGAETVPDEDSYLSYSRSLKRGLAPGADCEQTGDKSKSKQSRRNGRKNKPLREQLELAKRSVESVFKREVGPHRVIDLAMRSKHGKRKLEKKRLDVKSSFVKPDAKELFDKYNASMKKDIYKRVLHPCKHRIDCETAEGSTVISQSFKGSEKFRDLDDDFEGDEQARDAISRDSSENEG